MWLPNMYHQAGITIEVFYGRIIPLPFRFYRTWLIALAKILTKAKSKGLHPFGRKMNLLVNLLVFSFGKLMFKANKPVYMASLRQWHDITLDNFFLHVPNLA